MAEVLPKIVNQFVLTDLKESLQKWGSISQNELQGILLCKTKREIIRKVTLAFEVCQATEIDVVLYQVS